jgi:hypothetical protein
MRALAILLAVTLTGCASADYAAYTAAHTARVTADSKRLDGIASIARESNDPVARVAAIITLSHAESKQHDAIAKPTNILTELLQAGAGAYGIWAKTVLGVVDSTKSISASDEDVANRALNVLTPNLTGK